MPTLLGRLMARPPAEIEQIAAAWQARLPGRGHAEDVAALYRVMTDTWALRDILERLSPMAARRLWELVRPDLAGPDESAPAGPTIADPAETTGAAALAELAALGLLHHLSDANDRPVDGTAADLVLADETAALCRRLADERRQRDRATRPLADLLTTLDSGELAAAAEDWGLSAPPGSQPRAVVITALLDAIATPLALNDRVAALDRAARSVYDLTRASSRPLPITTIRRRSGLTAPVFRRAVRHLHHALLIWECWQGRQRHLFVPVELRLGQRQRQGQRPAPVEVATADWHHPLALAWDLLAWRRAAQLPHRSGTAPIDPLPASYALWYGPTGPSRQAYRAFLRAAAVATAAIDDEAWATQPLPTQQAALIERWRTAQPAWEETLDQAGWLPGDWPARRVVLLDCLAELTPEGWYRLDDLAGLITASGSRRAALDERLVLAWLAGPLTWLGLLECGREPAHRHLVTRLTPLASWCLGHGPPPPAPAADLVVEASLQVLVYAVDAPLLWLLLASTTPERLDRVSLFRLSRGSLVAGLALGVTAATLLTGLSAAARHPLPQNVHYSIEDWSRGARHARLERALLLTFDDARARDEALLIPALRTLGAEALPGDRLALPIADAAAEDEVRQLLRQLGFG